MPKGVEIKEGQIFLGGLYMQRYAHNERKKNGENLLVGKFSNGLNSPLSTHTHRHTHKIKAYEINTHAVLLLYLRVISAMSERERGKRDIEWMALESHCSTGGAKANESE